MIFHENSHGSGNCGLLELWPFLPVFHHGCLCWGPMFFFTLTLRGPMLATAFPVGKQTFATIQGVMSTSPSLGIQSAHRNWEWQWTLNTSKYLSFRVVILHPKLILWQQGEPGSLRHDCRSLVKLVAASVEKGPRKIVPLISSPWKTSWIFF